MEQIFKTKGGDDIPPIVSKLALEHFVRETANHTAGTLLFKLTEILTDTEDINTMAHFISDVIGLRPGIYNS